MTNVPESLGVDYARISDDDKGQQAGVNRQAASNADLAERRNITLAARFVDNSKSASNHLDKRDDFRAMLGYVNEHDVSYVIAWHPDRLLRSVAEGEEFISLCRRRGLVVLTVTAGEFDLSTAYGRKAFRDAVNGASYESEHRGERVRDARKEQALKGRWGGGVRPYGWGLVTDQLQRVWDKDAHEWVMRPFVDYTQHNPEEANEIRRMARQILSGVSITQVIKDLNARRVPTVTGGRWGNRQVRHIVTVPRVAGHAVYHGEIVQHNAWEPIISEGERQALITLLDDPSRKTSPGNQPKWLGSLIYKCGYCGKDTMSVKKRNDGLPVYRCRVHGHNGRDAVMLDAAVTETLLNVIKRDGADLIVQPVDVDVDGLTQERNALQGKLRTLTDMFVNDTISAEQLEYQTAKVNARIDGITRELTDAAASSPIADMVGVDDVKTVWARKTIGEKREILRTVLSVTVLPGSVRDVDADHVKVRRADR